MSTDAKVPGGYTNHSNKEPWLLRSTPDTGVSNDSDGETRSETSETDGKTGTKLDEALEEGHLRSNYKQQISICVSILGGNLRFPEIKTETTRP